jgi:hypothetical protein
MKFIAAFIFALPLLVLSGNLAFPREVQETGQEPTDETVTPPVLREEDEEDTSGTTDEETQASVSQKPTARVATGITRAPTTPAIESDLSGAVTHFDGTLLHFYL